MQNKSKQFRSRTRPHSHPPGIAMVLTLLLVGLLSVMALSLVSLSSSDNQISHNGSLSVQALYNADAGTEEAKMRVSPNAPSGMGVTIGLTADWRAYIYSGSIASPTQSQMQAAIQGLDPTYGKKAWDTSQTEGTTNYAFYNTVQATSGKINWGWARIQHKYDGSGNVLFRDVVTGSEVTAASQTVGTQTVNNLPILLIASEGIQKNVRRMIQMQLNPIVIPVSTTTTEKVDPFTSGAHGKDKVELIGNAGTDSYDSSKGAYGPGNKGHEGHVSTDATGNAVISIAPGSVVDGDAKVGPGGDISTAIEDKNYPNGITGTAGTESATVSMPLVTVPAGVTSLGAISIAGNKTYTLAEGTYVLSSLSITGNAKVITTGKVVIYVTGNVDIGGNGIATAGNIPGNLLIYGTSTCTDVKVHGNGNFYGAIYAPAATIRVDGSPTAQSFGALTGKSVTLNGNAKFHYDTSLKKVGEIETTTTITTYTSTGYARYAWHEIPF